MQERHLRQKAEQEKEELEKQLRHFQEESQIAHDALVSIVLVCTHGISGVQAGYQ